MEMRVVTAWEVRRLLGWRPNVGISRAEPKAKRSAAIYPAALRHSLTRETDAPPLATCVIV